MQAFVRGDRNCKRKLRGKNLCVQEAHWRAGCTGRWTGGGQARQGWAVTGFRHQARCLGFTPLARDTVAGPMLDLLEGGEGEARRLERGGRWGCLSWPPEALQSFKKRTGSQIPVAGSSDKETAELPWILGSHSRRKRVSLEGQRLGRRKQVPLELLCPAASGPRTTVAAGFGPLRGRVDPWKDAHSRCCPRRRPATSIRSSEWLLRPADLPPGTRRLPSWGLEEGLGHLSCAGSPGPGATLSQLPTPLLAHPPALPSRRCSQCEA